MKAVGKSRFACVLVLVAVMMTKPSTQASCENDEECKDIRECDIEAKYFYNRNLVELRKLKVCGTALGTSDYCCRLASPAPLVSTLTHKNLHLINEKRCGKTLGDRIVGGTKASVGQFPWMALLQYKPKLGGVLEFKCGGSLISKKHVLTAAHCIAVPGLILVSVRFGEHTISTAKDCDDPNDPLSCNNDNPPIQDIAIEETFMHPDFDRLRRSSDIGLIRLKSSPIIAGIRNVETICLPSCPQQMIDHLSKQESLNLTICGWGQNEESTMSDTLMTARVAYVGLEQCKALFRIRSRSKALSLTESHLCAGGGSEKRDFCSGDSGGPIMYPALNNEAKFRFFQHGIAVFGVDCANTETLPGVYTRVAAFMHWILDNLTE